MSEEKEIGSFETGLALGDDFFTDEPKEVPWENVLCSILDDPKFDRRLIKEPGLYSVRLTITKIK